MHPSKVCFMHIPKTAGTTMRQFFEDKFERKLMGSQNILANKQLIPDVDFLSGHIHLPIFESLLPNDDWKIITTFRNPYKYVVSHLCWVRKAVDPGQEARLRSDPAPFIKIAYKMKELDFSRPSDISAMVDWLEDEKMHYFHNTQTRYLLPPAYDRRLEISDLEMAISNFHRIDLVGDSERLNEFLPSVAKYFGWSIEESIKTENVNSSKYGLDLDCKLTRKVLDRLIHLDRSVYQLSTESHAQIVRKFGSLDNS